MHPPFNTANTAERTFHGRGVQKGERERGPRPPGLTRAPAPPLGSTPSSGSAPSLPVAPPTGSARVVCSGPGPGDCCGRRVLLWRPAVLASPRGPWS